MGGRQSLREEGACLGFLMDDGEFAKFRRKDIAFQIEVIPCVKSWEE